MTQPAGEVMPVPRSPVHAENAEIDAFLVHARWLMEFHTKRSDGLGTRAVALLGFVGVILALLTRGFDLVTKLHATWLLIGTLVLTVVALVATAGFALATLATRKVSAPSVDFTRQVWAEYLNDIETRGQARTDIAEMLLRGTQLDQDSPVSLSKAEADARAKQFKRALIAIAIAVTGLAVLIIQTYVQLGGFQ